jgi:hypothetical protein
MDICHACHGLVVWMGEIAIVGGRSRACWEDGGRGVERGGGAGVKEENEAMGEAALIVGDLSAERLDEAYG